MSSDSSKPDSPDTHEGVKMQATMSPAASADFVDVASHVNAVTDHTRIYTVAPGDCLSTIAARFYGTPDEARRIFDANRDQLVDPDRIKPGQMLKIPAKP